MPYRSITMRGVTLLCFPAHDLAFAAFAARHLRGLSAVEPERLQAELAETHPRVVVRAQHSLAALGGGAAWYVYRDGRYSPFVDNRRWWEEAGCAFLVVAEDGRYVDANQACLDLIGVHREQLLRMRTGDLTDPKARVTLPWLWALARDVGEVHSTSILRSPDGLEVPIEYHLVMNGAGPGLTISYMRRLADDPHDPELASDTGNGSAEVVGGATSESPDDIRDAGMIRVT